MPASGSPGHGVADDAVDGARIVRGVVVDPDRHRSLDVLPARSVTDPVTMWTPSPVTSSSAGQATTPDRASSQVNRT